MTIKPIVVVGSQKRNSESEKKETPVAEQQSGVLCQRNNVIDQSPQRRVEVYDDLARHRRSPHKSSRNKRRDLYDLHNKRAEREKHVSSVAVASVGKCNSPHVSGANSPAEAVGSIRSKTPEHLLSLHGSSNSTTQTDVLIAKASTKLLKAEEETYSGYNSGDEHLQPKEGAITVDEWKQRDEQFDKCMTERGYVLKSVEEDGACLFRAISLQIYGDEEMHDVIRQHTMDYIYKNREYFGHFVTEDINSYIDRKRRKDSHGNHIEIQAMSEIYSRPVEVYCYKPTPINIFNSEQKHNGYAPLRLSYQRGSHYNAIIDPYNATVGVGLGLAGYKPELQANETVRLSEQLEIEQTMFEDKLKTTDWEATNEAIEEQIARESYLQWCRENIQKSRAATASATASSSATVTSGCSDAEASPSKYAAIHRSLASTKTATATAGSSPVCESNATSTSNTKTEQHGLSTIVLHHSNFMKESLNASGDLGFDSDGTDMSSTSSIGPGGDNSVASASARAKKIKNRSSLRGSKKRRRDQKAAVLAGLSDASAEFHEDKCSRKSPKCNSDLLATGKTRAQSPDIEQRPCTSKQSSTPEKRQPLKASTSPVAKQPLSIFYQELLEASYDRDGFGQLTESEMLQQAIRMSTQDYIEDQNRKYIFGP